MSHYLYDLCDHAHTMVALMMSRYAGNIPFVETSTKSDRLIFEAIFLCVH